jgi:hypothetical protein
VGPGKYAQALSISAGVDEEEYVAAAGHRATAGAAAVSALFGKAWATGYLEGGAGAAAPVIHGAGQPCARESASAKVRIPRGSSDPTSTAPSCADGTPFPECSFASGRIVLVADASRGAGAVNGVTGSNRARPGYDEHAAAMHRLRGSRTAVDEDALSSERSQQKRTARAGCLRHVLRAVLLRGGLGRQCTLQAVASRVGCDLEAAGVPPHLIGSSALHLAKVGPFEVRSTTIRQHTSVGKHIAEYISDDDRVDDVMHALLRLLCREEREGIVVLDEKAPRCHPYYRDHGADTRDLDARIIAH